MLYLLFRVLKVRRSMRLYFCLFASFRFAFFPSSSFAQALPSSSNVFPSFASDVLSSKFTSMQSSGLLPSAANQNIPSLVSETLSAVESAGTAELAGSEAASWLAVAGMAALPEIAVGGALALAAGGAYYLYKSSSGVQLPGVNGSPLKAGSPYYYFFLGDPLTGSSSDGYGSTVSDAAAMAVENLASKQPSFPAGTYSVQSCSSKSCIFLTVDPKDHYTWHNSVDVQYYSSFPASCSGSGAFSQSCSGSKFPLEIPHGSVQSLPSAVKSLPASVLSRPADSKLLADTLNHLWQKASSQPGFKGVPYPSSSPLTSSDVASLEGSSNYPTLADLAGFSPSDQPANNHSGISPNPGIHTGTSSGSNSSNLPDGFFNSPDVPRPADPSSPLISEILDPIFSLFPGLKNFSVPSQSASCPKLEVTLFGKDISADTHCQLIEANKGTIGTLATVVYVSISLLIILSA